MCYGEKKWKLFVLDHLINYDHLINFDHLIYFDHLVNIDHLINYDQTTRINFMVNKLLKNQVHTLVYGSPGTGKTLVLANLIKKLD